MATILHRLRGVARMAGHQRLQRFDSVLHDEPHLARPLLEQSDVHAMVEALVVIQDRLEVETIDHNRRLATWMRELGEAIGLWEDELIQLERGALLHDIGKLSVAHDVLHRPRALEPQEMDRIKMHSSLGHAILFGLDGLRGATRLILTHHEYWDGSGYPDGLRANEIPLSARMFTIVDSYDAMLRTDREYRVGVSEQAALDELERLAGKKYDPALVAVWLRLQRPSTTTSTGTSTATST